VGGGDLMLDTSAYGAFKRGQREVVTALQHSSRVLLSAVAIGELLAGFAVGHRRAENVRELQAFLGRPRVTIASAGLATAERFAQIYAYLRSAGTPIPTADLWIAAAAMEHGAELLTLDAHFLCVPQVVVRHVLA